MSFSSREIATWFWLFVFIAYSMRKSEVRDSALAFVRAYFRLKTFFVFIFAYLYIAACVYILSMYNIWTVANIKTTIIWGICYSFQSMLRIDSVLDDPKYFKKSVKDIFAMSGLLAFIMELHSFSLIVEMIAVPALAIISLLQVVANSRHKGEPAEKIINFLVSIVGGSYVLYSLHMTFIKIDNIASTETLREYFVPVILAISFCPLLYFIAVFFSYERAFTLLDRVIKHKDLANKAKIRSLFEFKFNVKNMKRWLFSVMRFIPQDEKDLDDTFCDERIIEKRENNPPVIPRNLGWSPFTVKEFLSSEGIVLRDYIKIEQDEWSACSNYLDVDEGILPNKISLYSSGNDLVVTEIKLILDVSNPEFSTSAEHRFKELAVMLLSKAIDSADATKIFNALSANVSEGYETAYDIVTLKCAKWSGGIKGGYSRTLIIKSKSHKERMY